MTTQNMLFSSPVSISFEINLNFIVEFTILKFNIAIKCNVALDLLRKANKQHDFLKMRFIKVHNKPDRATQKHVACTLLYTVQQTKDSRTFSVVTRANSSTAN